MNGLHLQIAGSALLRHQSGVIRSETVETSDHAASLAAAG